MNRQTPNISQISDNLKLVSDLTSRMDERIKILLENKDATEEELEELRGKIKDIEIKIEMINVRVGSHDLKWSNIFDTIWKIGLMTIAAYILYALGLQSPPS